MIHITDAHNLKRELTVHYIKYRKNGSTASLATNLSIIEVKEITHKQALRPVRLSATSVGKGSLHVMSFV